MTAPPYKRWIFIITFGLGFLGYELWALYGMRPQVWMEDRVALLSSESGQTLVVGKSPWFEDLVISEIGSLLRRPSIHRWEDLEGGNLYRWPGLSVSKITPEVGLVDMGESRFLLLTGEVENWETIFSKGLDLEADFWLLWENQALQNLPLPRRSIFTLHKKLRKPKVQALAHQNQIPFGWVREEGALFLEKHKDAWEIKTSLKKKRL